MKQLRLLSTLLALILCTALHAEVVNGTCGNKLTWTLNTETGLLKIEGSGEMNNYGDYGSSSWFSYRNQILALDLPEGLTNIGSSAFSGCNGLTSVTIPSSVTIIGYWAFSNCSRLASVTIPNSVTSIGELAFESCSGLTSVTIPNSVNNIGSSAFYGCSGLTSVTIPNSVNNIGSSAFYGCSGLTSVTIPNSVTNIGSAAFAGCSGLTTVTIPNSVTNIGQQAFYDCSGLTSVTIPNSVTNIGSSAFSGCSGLTSVTIPNSVTDIGQCAFYGCSGLTSVTIPNSVTDIGQNAFYGCSGLTEPIIVNDMFVRLPTNYKGPYIVPDNITKIIDGAFHDCSSLTSVTFPKSMTDIGNLDFYGCSSLTSFTIPRSVTHIKRQAFYGCSSLTSVTIPNSVTYIDSEAFYNCSGLTSVTIPNSVTYIDSKAFYGCHNIKTLYMNSSVDPEISCEELYIGDDVTIVQNYYNSWKLRKVVLGKKVSQIRAEAFKNANIKEFTIAGEEPPYCYPNIFGIKDLSSATLYVPDGKAPYYQTTNPWTKFGKVKTLSGETPPPPTACGKPTISYVNGQLQFSDETEGAKYHCTITSPDMKSDILCDNGSMDLAACYNICIYATADGYSQSETATATLYWVKDDGSLTTDNINSAKMRGIVVTADNGFVRVSGLTDGEQVQFYASNGKLLQLQAATNGTATLATSEPVVICKMGETSIKVRMK